MPNIIEQIEIHEMAQLFYTRSGAAAVVIITSKPELLVGQFPAETKLYIVCPRRVEGYHNKLGALLPNTEFITSTDLNDEFLKDKIMVCIDFLSDLSLFTWLRKRRIKRITAQPLISIIVMRHSRQTLRLNDQASLIGIAKRFASSRVKNQQVVLYGQLIDVYRHKFPILPVLAIMHVFNEQDIINDTVNHLLGQGVDVHIIDNWSTDNTYAIIKSLASASKRVSYERFPEKANHKFELAKMLTRVTEVAKAKPQYKWVMLNDADEIRWSPWQDLNLQQALSFVDSVGYSAVDYTVFNFVPTKEGFGSGQRLLSFFEYGEFSGLAGHFVQVKSWKNNPEASLAPSGGHHVNFTNLKIFPLKFFLSHYPIRSSQHAHEKIFRQRKARFSLQERRKGWHAQYDNIDKSTSFIGDHNSLIKFGTPDFWKEFIVERLSGVGIKRD